MSSHYSTAPRQTLLASCGDFCFQTLETLLYRKQVTSLPALHQHGNQTDSDITSAGQGRAGEEIPRRCQPVLFQPCGLLSLISVPNNLTFVLNQFTSLLAVTLRR
jgi:hypothetical protein